MDPSVFSITAGEHQVQASLPRRLYPEWPQVVDFEVVVADQWELLDSCSLADIEPEGMWLDDDGSLSLRYAEIEEETMEEKPSAFTVALPATEIERLVAWAHERARFKAPLRARPSALAEPVRLTA